jgi:hypothetical protein
MINSSKRTQVLQMRETQSRQHHRGSERIRQLIDITADDRGLRIGLGRCLEAHVGLRLHEGEFRACLLRFVLDPSDWDETNRELRLSSESCEPAEAIANKLASSLERIARQPLTPRMVNSALNITTKERLRWTKDGRLKVADRVQITKGRVNFSIPTYAISQVEKLIGDPSVIFDWRERDAQSSR